MADLQGDDLFAVNRDGATGTIQQSELMAKLQDDDLMLVNRDNTTYTVTGEDVIGSIIDELSLTPVVTPANPIIGETLTVAPNSAGGKSPFTYTYQWKHKDSIPGAVVDYVGETSSTYVTTGEDEGELIACEVTVTDSRGSTATALSAFTTGVIKPPTVDDTKHYFSRQYGW